MFLGFDVDFGCSRGLSFGLGGLGLGAGAVVGAKKHNLNCFSCLGLLLVMGLVLVLVLIVSLSLRRFGIGFDLRLDF